MRVDETESEGVKKLANLLLMFAVAGFAVSSSLVVNQYLNANKQGIESRYFPPAEDFTFRNWRQEPNGHWSAEVFYFKARPECLYVPTQIVTVTYNNPMGEIGESLIKFIGDSTVGNTRPEGWQRIDKRVEFLDPAIGPGTLIRGSFLHQCHDGLPTVSRFRSIVVGQDMPWPPYVQEWIDSGLTGTPAEYR